MSQITNISSNYRSMLGALVVSGNLVVEPAFAQMSMRMPMSAATPNPQLLGAFVSAGGGAAEFKTVDFINALTAGRPQERTRLQKRFGQKTLATFDRVLAFVVEDSIKGKPQQATSESVAPGLAAALYRAGTRAGGRFNVEQLFDVLFGRPTHDRVMGDVAQRFGASGEAAYHQVLTALIVDIGRVRPAPPRALNDVPMNDMPAMDAPTGAASPSAMLSSIPKPTSSSSPMSMGAPLPVASGMSMPMGSPVPSPSGTPMEHMQRGDRTIMPTNANGVRSMYGMRQMQMSMNDVPVRSMPAVTDLGQPMSREGSGTAWLPDSSTVFGHMSMSGNNMFMTHGAGFVRYSDAFTNRGSRTFNAPDWYMVMGSHPLSPASQFGARVMVTSDFVTVGGFGYPELFQTGETFHGKALHDHQHPHDLFSEAALTYSAQISRNSSAFVYVGYPGEPALGPPTYMHRLIAYDVPDAPIGHHWQDSTHITFGVVTGGVAVGNAKFEASSFTGREPNEIRTNFDPIGLDSYSGRVSWNPSPNIAAQVSYGFIKSPEALAPTIDQRRSTASIVLNKPLALGEFFTASVVLGQNYDSDATRSNAYLLEADYHRRSDGVYGRAEFVQKSGHELVLDAVPLQLTTAPRLAETLFPIGGYTLGYVHDFLLRNGGMVAGVGGQLTFNTRPGSLVSFYGPQTPLGFEIFARVRPPAVR